MTRAMALDPANFARRNGMFRGSMRTAHDGIVDLAVTGEDAPSPAAFMELDAAAAEIDWMRKRGVAAAAHHRETALNWRAVAESEWTINGLSANDEREVVVSLYEGEIDTYGDWDVTFLDGEVKRVERRQI